jgi:aminoglycoside phosphotransferase family enzyme/predicted kinase
MGKSIALPAGERRLLAFLLDPRSYPERPRRIRLLQTHSAWVVLAGAHAYKVKKPVNFGFLDFSTLEKRRYFCEREVLLNQRLCPWIYLGVVPLSLHGGRLQFGNGGRVVEYAVKMRRMAERGFLPRLLRSGKLGIREVNQVVSVLGAFYSAQHPGPHVTQWGGVARLKLSTDENFRQTRAFIGQTVSRVAFEAVRYFTNRFYARKRALLESRVRRHRIRDCHGDLHLDHVHLGPDELSIFDCIEFNDRFRYIDVASDVAFLAMDLDFHGRPDLARHLVARIADMMRDRGLGALTDFYKCYRAYVRGKVESLLQAAVDVPAAKRAQSRARARRYFRLALQYAAAGSEPMVLVVMGRVCSGKSTLAKALGEELGWEVFSSDRMRKELAGVPLYKRGSTAERRRLYVERMTRRTYGRLIEEAVAALKAHRSVILDATFSRRIHRDLLRRELERRKAGCRFLEVRAPEAVVRRRLKQREGDRRVISDARLEDMAMLNRSFERPVELPGGIRLTVDARGSVETSIIAAFHAMVDARFS